MPFNRSTNPPHHQAPTFNKAIMSSKVLKCNNAQDDDNDNEDDEMMMIMMMMIMA